jgi:adenine modification enzyme
VRDLIYNQDLVERRPVGITDGLISLVEDSSGRCDGIIQAHHYSHKTTKNRFLSFLVNGGLGAIQLGYGIRPKMKHTISTEITADNFCEFDRMWLSDDLPKFSESRTIGLLLSYIKRVHSRIKFIITYADESAGNKGTIYKATNAIQLESVKCDFYILPDGERIHPVSMYHRHKTRAKAFVEKQYPGIKHINGEFQQFRFLYILDNKLRRKFQGRNGSPPDCKGGFNSHTPLQIPA